MSIRQKIFSSFMRLWPRKFESEEKDSIEQIVELLVIEYEKDKDLFKVILVTCLKSSDAEIIEYLNEQNNLVQRLIENNQPELDSGWGGVDAPIILYKLIRSLALFDVLAKSESLGIGTYLLLNNLLKLNIEPTNEWVHDLINSYEAKLNDSIEKNWSSEPNVSLNTLETFERTKGNDIEAEFDEFCEIVQEHEESLHLSILERNREIKLLWWMSIKHTFSSSETMVSYRSFERMTAGLYMAYDVIQLLKEDIPAPNKVKAVILECLYSIWPELAMTKEADDIFSIKLVLTENQQHFNKLDLNYYFKVITSYVDESKTTPTDFSILMFDLLQAKHLLTLIEEEDSYE